MTTLLNRMVSSPAIGGSTSSSYNMLRSFIKISFAEEHILLLIGLAKTLDDLVIVPRTAKFVSENLGAEFEQGTTVPDFNNFEKSLWYGASSCWVLWSLP